MNVERGCFLCGWVTDKVRLTVFRNKDGEVTGKFFFCRACERRVHNGDRTLATERIENDV